MSSPERRLRVSFQGELGAPAEDAIAALFGTGMELVPCETYVDTVHAVVQDNADRAVLPVEHSLTGAIGEAHDAMADAVALHAIAEAAIHLHYCLIAPSGTTLESVMTVLSHSSVLAQCQDFFRAYPRIQAHGSFDVASAAREVAQLGDPSFAAVSGRAAAARYKLDVVAADIEDRRDSQMRFVALARESAVPAAGTAARTMLVFTTQDTPGALLAALAPLAERGVNVRRINTRPGGAPWTFRYLLECDHHVGDPATEAALRAMARTTRSMRVIGTYARWQPERRGSIGWTPMDVPIIA